MEYDALIATAKKAARWGSISILALMTGYGCYYTVDQNEVGAVTRFGELISSGPVPPGIHFKAPWIDTAHTVRVSIDKIPIPEVKAKTIDNQFVKIDTNLSYHTGDPFRALFKVGDVGDASIHDKLIPYVQSRILDEIGKVNALQITDQKGAIEASILKDVKSQVFDLFGESIDDVQITAINYDAAFEANIQKMVETRNMQVSATNMLTVRKTEAEQAAAVATGEANAAIARAEGAKQQQIKTAEGNAEQIKLQAEAQAQQTRVMGEANAAANLAIKTAEAQGIQKVGESEASVIKLKTAAAGNAGTYAEILRAQAQINWKGDVPRYVFGNGANPTQPLMMIPNENKE